MTKKTSENKEVIERVETKIDATETSTKKYKTEKCKVLAYNDSTKELDIDFKGYGIRIYNVEEVKSDFISLRYRGEIGKPNFAYML